jgi:hypothetical protein
MAKSENNLKRIQKNVEESYLTNRHNYLDYHDSMRFLYKSTLTEDEISLLKQLGRPTLEFNIMEAYVSRLCGEFSKQEPSMVVRQEDMFQQVDPRLPQLVEGITRAIFDDARNDYLEYETYRNMMSGGFDVWKVFTDWSNEMSFNQDIKVKRVFDPTLCGFDITAKESSKADGRYCFELFPKPLSILEKEFGTKILDGIKPTKDIGGFNWCFSGAQEPIALVGDYYEKQYKDATIVQLVTGQTMTVDDYEQQMESFNKRSLFMQAPGIIGKPRRTKIVTIKQCHIIQDKIIFEKDTDYRHLPLVFFAGNSARIREGAQGNYKEITRSYIKNAMGIQRLMNFAGQSLANELENIVQHKWVVAKRAIPKNYQDAYRNNQVPNVVIFNDVDENGKEIPPPREVQRAPAPPEVANTFMNASQIMQSVLGSYDAQLGINNNQLSGVAIQEGATQSNATAMPYIIGFLRGMNQTAQIIVDLIPKYYDTPRTVPIVKQDGKRDYVLINHQQGIPLQYSSNALQIKVSAGVNFAIQQQQALNAILSLAKESPLFQQFINQYGLEVLLDNIDIRGIDQLKQSAAEFMKKLQQEQAQQAQMAQAMNPAMLKKQELDQKERKMQMDAQLDAARIANEQESTATDRILALAQIGEMTDKVTLERDKVQAENARTASEAAVDLADVKHRHAMDLLNLHHTNMNKQQSAQRSSS